MTPFKSQVDEGLSKAKQAEKQLKNAIQGKSAQGILHIVALLSGRREKGGRRGKGDGGPSFEGGSRATGKDQTPPTLLEGSVPLSGTLPLSSRCRYPPTLRGAPSVSDLSRSPRRCSPQPRGRSQIEDMSVVDGSIAEAERVWGLLPPMLSTYNAALEAAATKKNSK